MTAKPFVKWAGGKSQLLTEIAKEYPDKIDSYCEPFVGGGAVLLDVLEKFHPASVLINDINPELINAYTQIRDRCEVLIERLSQMQNAFWDADKDARKRDYYAKRERYNESIAAPGDPVEKAALFIFLNKTCFNGLYRVNARGFFNVPMGSYKKPPICDAENLMLIHDLLRNTRMLCGDYSRCADFIGRGTFVYIDPPYRPLSRTASFTAYAKTAFDDDEQIRLADFMKAMSDKGARMVASNSDPKNTDENDNFFDDIYSDFSIRRVRAARMINSDASARGTVSELLIRNFEKGREL